jgi:hypothetical protein
LVVVIVETITKSRQEKNRSNIISVSLAAISEVAPLGFRVIYPRFVTIGIR